MRFKIIVYFILIWCNNTIAQNGCPVVNAGPDANLNCANPCANLNATFFQVGNTTNYTVASVPYAPLPYNVGTPVLVNIDDTWSGVINLPFNFCFYGNVYNQVVIGSNGLITFDVSEANGYCEWSMAGLSYPDPSAPTNCIMGPYQDIDPTNMGDIFYQIGGVAPCRYFVVSFYEVPYFGDANSVSTGSCAQNNFATSQIILYETTNAIDVYIEDKDVCSGWNSGLAALGIQNAAGTVATMVPGRNNTSWSATNEGWRFTPSGPSIVSVSWEANGVVVGNGASINVCPTVPTVYTAVATYIPCAGGSNIIVTDNVLVTPGPSTINTNISSLQGVTCFGGTNGNATVTASGGNPPFSYAWSPGGGNTNSLSNVAAGNYTLTITDSAGCIVNVPVIIAPGITLSATIQSTPTLCNGSINGSLIATPTNGQGPYSYSWSPAGGNAASASNLAAGNYSVTITDGNGCTNNFQGTVASPPILNVNNIIQNANCQGINGQAVITATGGTAPYTYNWSAIGSGASASNLTPGNYTVTVVDQNGCTQATAFAIGQPVQLQFSLANTTVSCFGGGNGTATANITSGTGPYTYLWSPTGGNAATATGLAAGNYSLTITDANGCVQSQNTTISQPAVLLTSATQTNVACYGGNTGNATVNTTGGIQPYQYAWSPSGGNAATAANLSAGSYTVVATDGNGCTTTNIVNITEPQQLLSTANTDSTDCSGTNGTAVITAVGGVAPYNYNWSPSGGNAASNTSLSPGNYTVTITDDAGCQSMVTFDIYQPVPLTFSVTNNNIDCYGAANGNASLAITSGSAPFSIVWSNGITDTTQITSLQPGNYNVFISDYYNCTLAQSFTITEPAALQSSLQSTDVACHGDASGNIFSTVQGGTGTYQYTWLPSGNGPNLLNVMAGNYNLIVTDANGCTSTSNAIITQPDALLQLVIATDTLCQLQPGNITVNNTGGVTPYTINWSNGNSSNSYSYIGQNSFSVNIQSTDANGCTVPSQLVNVYVHPPLQLASSTSQNICYGDSISLSAQASGGNGGPYTYSWNSGQLSGSQILADPFNSTNYIVEASDGCSPPESNALAITVAPLPVPNFTSAVREGCVPLNISFTNQSTATNGSIYQWSFGDNSTSTLPNPSHNYTQAGSYSVSLNILTPQGCTGSYTYNAMISVNPNAESNFATSDDVLDFLFPSIKCFDQSSFSDQYIWHFGDGTILNSGSEVTHTYTSPGLYNIMLLSNNAFNCPDSSYRLVLVEKEMSFFIPNAFTPNADGVNDQFIPDGTGYSDYTLRIFDRWGLPVFFSTNKNYHWNGRMHNEGAECQEDVYVYLITINDDKGNQQSLTGKVSIVR